MQFLHFAQVSQGAGAPNPFMMQVILFGGMIAIFYFLLIRPQKKRQDDHKKMVESLKKNDEVITVGGIYGTVVNVKDDRVVVRLDDNVKVEFQKSAVSTIIKKS